MADEKPDIFKMMGVDADAHRSGGHHHFEPFVVWIDRSALERAARVWRELFGEEKWLRLQNWRKSDDG